MLFFSLLTPGLRDDDDVVVGVFYTGNARVRGVDVLCDLCEAIKNWDRSVTFLHKHLLLSKVPHCRYRCVCPTNVLSICILWISWPFILYSSLYANPHSNLVCTNLINLHKFVHSLSLSLSDAVYRHFINEFFSSCRSSRPSIIEISSTMRKIFCSAFSRAHKNK